MKTPNRQPSIKLNKYAFHSFQKINKKKLKKPEEMKGILYDEIELKDQLIKENHKKIKKIKIDSIKDLVYANKNVPDKWKKKVEYPTQVLELFSRDSKFLNYVGRGESGRDSGGISKSTQNYKNNLTNNNYNKTSYILNKGKNYRNNKLSLSILTENNKDNNVKKYCRTTPTKIRYRSLKEKYLNEKEIINILDELQINYPIKEKLNELFPQEELQKIKMKNEILKNKSNKNNHYPIIKTEKSKDAIKKNIYINLFSSEKNIKKRLTLLTENTNINYLENCNYDILKLKKELIKSPIANKHLERINFYGPYFSYCPPCGIRNLNFYQKLPLNQLIQLTNIIKKYRQRK